MHSGVIYLLVKVIQFYHYKCIFMQNQESCTSLHISVINQVLDINVFAFVDLSINTDGLTWTMILDFGLD